MIDFVGHEVKPEAKTKHYLIYTLLSLVVHVIIILYFWLDKPTEKITHYESDKSVHVFLESSLVGKEARNSLGKIPNNPVKTPNPMKISKKKFSNLPRNVPLKTQNNIHKNNLKSSDTENFNEKSFSAEKPISKALIALLHQGIQEHQHYPKNNLELRQEGTVTIQFQLMPNGEAHQISIQRSSGYSEMDQAAKQAVSDASPFQGVEFYLESPKIFEINIVFSLDNDED